MYAHGQQNQSADPGRAHQPPGYPEPGMDRGGGGGVRGKFALRLPRPVLYRPFCHPNLDAGGRANHRLQGELSGVPVRQGEGKGRLPGRSVSSRSAAGKKGQAQAPRRNQKSGEGGQCRRAGGSCRRRADVRSGAGNSGGVRRLPEAPGALSAAGVPGG